MPTTALPDPYGKLSLALDTTHCPICAGEKMPPSADATPSRAKSEAASQSACNRVLMANSGCCPSSQPKLSLCKILLDPPNMS